MHPELARRGVAPDLVTDQTSAHDLLNGYVPRGLSLDEAAELRARDPKAYVERALRVRWPPRCARCSSCSGRAPWSSTTATTSAREAEDAGVPTPSAIPGFVPAFIRPLFCEGNGPFRWVALSGDPEDIAATDRALLEAFPDDEHLVRWLRLAPASACTSRGCPRASAGSATATRATAGLLFNDLVAHGQGEGADRHRPRPPRLRLGRVAEPRDRGDEGRLRRHRRLADPQRAAQHRRRRRAG